MTMTEEYRIQLLELAVRIVAFHGGDPVDWAKRLEEYVTGKKVTS